MNAGAKAINNADADAYAAAVKEAANETAERQRSSNAQASAGNVVPERQGKRSGGSEREADVATLCQS